MSAHGDAPVAVVGGGPAGCAAAIGLARAGLPVVLFEREPAARPKVCGEFVSAEACAALAALDVDLTLLGAARVQRLRVEWGRASVATRLPFVAASVSRAALDGALLAAAAKAGAAVRLGTRVLTAAACAETGGLSTITYRPAEPGGAGASAASATLAARAVILATGKHDLAARRRSGGHRDDYIGFKSYVALTAESRAELADAVELTLFGDGYAGMQHVEGEATALALLIRRGAYGRLGSWARVLTAIAASAPRFARRLAGARELRDKPLAIAGTPYGFVHRAPEDGFYRVGDQLAVIPSFTGDGIAIALESGARAARAIANRDDAAAFHVAMRRALRRPMFVAGTLSRGIATPAGRAAVMWPAVVMPSLFRAAAALTRIVPSPSA